MASMIFKTVVFLGYISYALCVETSCHTTNRFEYEYGVLQKLEYLERERNGLAGAVADLTAKVATLQGGQEGLDSKTRACHSSACHTPAAALSHEV